MSSLESLIFCSTVLSAILVEILEIIVNQIKSIKGYPTQKAHKQTDTLLLPSPQNISPYPHIVEILYLYLPYSD